MSTASALRFQLERTLERPFPSALTPKTRTGYEIAPCGIPAVDELLDGGLPVGEISEISGTETSGRTSLALSFLALRTGDGQACAWVDVNDTLDPESAAANGVSLRQLLWVRCRDAEKTADRKPWTRLDQALKAVDLILQAAGFAAVVLDLGSTAPEHASRIPLATWFRFRQGAQRSRTSLLVLGRMPYGSAGVMRGLRFDVRRQRQRFPQTQPGGRKPPASTWSAGGSWDATRRA